MGLRSCKRSTATNRGMLSKRERPDVALIDVSMPKGDGIAVLRFIKEVSPRTIVVLMTGMGSEEVAVQALRLGASDYLNKPFTMAEVLGLVMKLIEGRQVSEENIRLRRQVRRRERYLAHLTKIINEALITADSMGRIQFVNRAATQLWGYSRSELKDKDIHLLLSPDSDRRLPRGISWQTLLDLER